MNRPSPKELFGKIKKAQEAIKERNCYFANEAKNKGELEELNLIDSDELWGLIAILLKEIDPVNDYAGGRPPESSYEQKIKDKELFPFCWWSEHLKRTMYLKFVVIEGAYFHVSLHESK